MTTENQEQDFPDIDNLSDEEIMSMELPDLPPSDGVDTTDHVDGIATEEDLAKDYFDISDDSVPDTEESEEEQEDDEAEEGGDPEASAEGETDDEEESDGEEEDNPFTEESESDDEQDDTDEEESDIEEEDKDAESQQSDGKIDYKAQYEAIFKPFKANGREVQVKSVEDAIQLMQMGANYNQKMQQLKPVRKFVKMLQNNDLLDEDKINHLIDLSNGDKGAIAKLLKDKNLDSMDIDTEESGKYAPNTYTVSDTEVELDDVLADIQDTPTFKRTLDIVNNKWDKASQQILAGDPESIRVLNGHVANGTYDHVMGVVENERMMGRLTGLTDIEAYREVILAMQQEQAKRATEQQAKPRSVPSKRKSGADKQERARAQKKRGASSPTDAGGTPKSQDVNNLNPLDMDDSEFEKMAASLNLR